MWTRFMDMHSGGSKKEKAQYIFINAPMEEAKRLFEAKFDHNPDRVTCECCGEDYWSLEDGNTLEEATHYDRTQWRKIPLTMAEYIALPDVLIVYTN